MVCLRGGLPRRVWQEGPLGRVIPAFGMSPLVPIRPAVRLCSRGERTQRVED